MKKTLELSDFLDYRFPSRLTPSPDKKNVAFIVSQGSYQDNGYHADVYVFDRETRAVRQATRRGDIKSVVWADNETLLVGVGKHPYPARDGK